MNWRTVALYFVLAFVIEMIGVEIIRSIVDRRRMKRDGIGGTQDIAILGSLIGVLLLAGAVVSAAMVALTGR